MRQDDAEAALRTARRAWRTVAPFTDIETSLDEQRGYEVQSGEQVIGGPIGIGLWFALRGLGLTEIEVVEPSEPRHDRRPHRR